MAELILTNEERDLILSIRARKVREAAREEAERAAEAARDPRTDPRPNDRITINGKRWTVLHVTNGRRALSIGEPIKGNPGTYWSTKIGIGKWRELARAEGANVTKGVSDGK